MTFGETLYNLRKNKNLSQESLAQELNTSRQAVSKWENNQGFPETEKLKMISNIFGVSIDYLLNGERENIEHKEEIGYYASKEEIEGYLIYQRRVVKSVSLGIFLIILSGIPYLLLPDSPVIYTVLSAVLIIGGGAKILMGCFRENNYKKIKEETLIIDNTYLTTLRDNYGQVRRKYIALLISGICLGFISLVLTVILEDILHVADSGYHAIPLLILAAATFMLVYSAALMDSYKIVTANGEHIRKKEIHKKKWTTHHIVASVLICIVTLIFIYIITDGQGRISYWIDKIISYL